MLDVIHAAHINSLHVKLLGFSRGLEGFGPAARSCSEVTACGCGAEQPHSDLLMLRCFQLGFCGKLVLFALCCWLCWPCVVNCFCNSALQLYKLSAFEAATLSK